MDDIKVFAKNEKELEILIQTTRIYSQDKGMEFGIEKCAILTMKSGKFESVEGIEVSNQECIRTFGEKESYKYLGMMEADNLKKAEIKEN